MVFVCINFQDLQISDFDYIYSIGNQYNTELNKGNLSVYF